MGKENYETWSKEELIREIKKLRKRKKYGLVWEDKPEQVAELCKDKLPILAEVKAREIIKDKNKPVNMIIEGDNYHSLSVLNYTHKGKIDFIYIDPPYNTGNDTWKYNNKYIDDEDPFRHSKWISFMYKRLKLAKHLLSKDGVICVTIDNYEVHNLRHLMEEIFGDKEIIITVIEYNYRGRVTSNFALTHEYAIWGVPKRKEIITRLEEKSEDIRRNLRRTGQGSRRTESPTLFFGIEVDKNKLEIISVTKPIQSGEKLPISKSKDTIYVFPIDRDGIERRWYYSPYTVLEEAKKGNVWAKKISGKIEIHYWKPGKEKMRKSVWSGSRYDGSTYGSELLTEIIGDNDFPFPKSIYAVKECIEAATDKKDAWILDFFAGSGTTGHAVLQMNKEDKGNRKFILCTNNEGNICQDITFPRIKNVIQGYKYKGKEKEILFEENITYPRIKESEQILETIEQIKTKRQKDFDKFEIRIEDNNIRLCGIREISGSKDGLGGNLKYFVTDFVDAEPTDINKKKLVDRSTDMLCLRENCFELVKRGKEFQIFSDGNGNYLGIIYDDAGIEAFKKEVKNLNKKFVVYVFSLDESAREEEFEDILDLVQLKPIPAVILSVYKRIFK